MPVPVLRALVDAESSGNPNAVSKSDARGWTQLMAGTAQDLHVNRDDPMQNMIGGARYLRQLYDRYHGNLSLALAAYNEGAGKVDQGVFYPETRAYVNEIENEIYGR